MGELSIFDEAGGNVPAHIRAKWGAVNNSDMSAGVNASFSILSYKGKVWHVVQGDNRTLIKGEDGEPRSSIEVVILKANPTVSKLYYKGGYVEGNSDRPTCYSHDGVAPAIDAVEKQSLKCAICPHNQWGSKTTESGAKGKECSDSRRLAVAAAGDLENPMLLRVPAATLKDLKAYGDLLARRETPYQAVVTKIGFDYDVAYQKLTFTALRWLDAGDVNIVAEVLDGPVVEAIIGDGGGRPETPLDIDGSRPDNINRLDPAEKLSPKVNKILEAAKADVEAVLEAEPVKVKPVTKPKVDPAVAAAAAAALAKEKKLAALKAQMAALEAEEGGGEPVAAAEPEPVEAGPVKRDHSKLIAEASASLNDVLGTLDD